MAEIESRINAACRRADRQRDEVKLIGVSKRQSLARIREALACGLSCLGENQVQEAVTKSAELPATIEWHFIGHLQSNKVKPAVRLFNIFHSVDRLKLARRLDAEAERTGRTLQVFLQANLGGEASKSGFGAGDLSEVVRELEGLSRLELVGLMAIPPYEEDLERARAWFRELRELRDEVATLRPDFPGLLSMGMSHDFEVAIEEGATHIRVGTSLFGSRP